MLLSELLGCRVHALDGADLGVVVDARFRRGARQGRREGDLELVALIVSPHSRLSFYGYERGRVNAPALINAIITRMHRASRIVPWECVETVGDGDVRLGVDAPFIPLDARRPIGEARGA
ncbi:PRC-barrel domain-containing protein [Microbacterium sp. B2969]|uniref:PRC-barrel domain-containing protein n=1 Tax=Microbacterium alkaliflavum TaxID=3248839 RepID=A0ABW7QC63_9MICO